ncbi:hypothetical protein ACFZCK_00185 [Kitasatospora purpeofusca]|uniref:hypothetical protein n=1 Tax=Kitasatospora purpeofusca TaxID=67352 RepID=UPI0036E49017
MLRIRLVRAAAVASLALAAVAAVGPQVVDTDRRASTGTTVAAAAPAPQLDNIIRE